MEAYFSGEGGGQHAQPLVFCAIDGTELLEILAETTVQIGAEVTYQSQSPPTAT